MSPRGKNFHATPIYSGKCDRCGVKLTAREICFMNYGKNAVCTKCGEKWSEIYEESIRKRGRVKTQRIWNKMFRRFLNEKSKEKVIFT